MPRTLRNDALAIWSAGVSAVDSSRLVRAAIQRSDQHLTIADETIPLNTLGRLIVVGGGKAGAGMAQGLIDALGGELVEKKVHGWLNVPADCVKAMPQIVLHPGRPAGQNEPTEAGVAGTQAILRLAGELQPQDVCVVLLSGGGSALLPAPVAGISLEDKQSVTRLLMRSGAAIAELNLVRSCLSQIKCGGLLRAMRAGRCITLIISDVVGDPLTTIASGPTVPSVPDYEQALRILRVSGRQEAVPPSVWQCLHNGLQTTTAGRYQELVPYRNVIIGNNQTAVTAAARRAEELGYEVIRQTSDEGGVAREIGTQLAKELHLKSQVLPNQTRQCIISGGEPVVRLDPTGVIGLGGRNQELVLAAANTLWDVPCDGLVLLSGGTDGEDGPTDAAGAVFDEESRHRGQAMSLQPEDYLHHHDAYHFHHACGSLLKTGPTHTNVMDLRVGLATGK